MSCGSGTALDESRDHFFTAGRLHPVDHVGWYLPCMHLRIFSSRRLKRRRRTVTIWGLKSNCGPECTGMIAYRKFSFASCGQSVG